MCHSYVFLLQVKVSIGWEDLHTIIKHFSTGKVVAIILNIQYRKYVMVREGERGLENNCSQFLLYTCVHVVCGFGEFWHFSALGRACFWFHISYAVHGCFWVEKKMWMVYTQ